MKYYVDSDQLQLVVLVLICCCSYYVELREDKILLVGHKFSWLEIICIYNSPGELQNMRARRNGIGSFLSVTVNSLFLLLLIVTEATCQAP